MRKRRARELTKRWLPLVLVCGSFLFAFLYPLPETKSSVHTVVILTVGNDTKLDDLHRLARDTVFSNTRSARISAQVLVYEGKFRPWFNTSTADDATVVQASRKVERLRYGSHSFELFSGIYGASVKPRALRWLTQPDQAWIDFGWIIEPDVVFTGSWQTLFEKYESDSSDLIAFNTTFRYSNKTAWNHWPSCTYCRGLPNWCKQSALLPAFRISRNFAAAAVAHLSTSTRSSGHHEAFLPTFLTVNSDTFSFRDLGPDVAYMRWRPAFDFDAVPRLSPIRRDALYHPVKSLEMYRNLSQASLEA